MDCRYLSCPAVHCGSYLCDPHFAGQKLWFSENSPIVWPTSAGTCPQLASIVKHLRVLKYPKLMIIVNRGVAAGFFLQAITSALGAASSFLVPLGLNLESLVQSGAWVSSVIGLPLLAFGFHWLHGDHSTANVTLGSGLLLAAGFDYLTPEGRDMVAHSVAVATLTSTLIISILAGNYYGMLGSVMVTLSGLIAAMKAERLLVLRKEDALNCILLVGTLAFQKAFRTANIDLV